MRAHRNILYFLGAFFTMLGQLGATMFILSLMNTEDFSDISTEDHDNKKRRAVKMMQELLKNGTATNELKLGEIFGLLGVTASGYSYNMQFLFLVEEVELTCGIHQFEIVGSLFPNLARPAEIIGAAGEKSVSSNLCDHCAGSELKGRRMVAAWRREMRNSLHCLVTTEEGTLLADTIEMYAVLANRRLDFL